MNLTLGPGMLDEIIQHAKNAYPKEACGLVVGSRFLPMPNIADSETEYEMNPQDLFNVLRDARNRGEQLVAIYHSHPNGPARPSKRDIERAYYPEAAHLIVSLADVERPRAAVFRIIDGQVLEVELHAIV